LIKNKNKVKIFTDGACRGNPGPGGWGALLKYGDVEKKINGYSNQTTNNIMELTAAVESLKMLKRTCNIIITTDSNYVKNGITSWIKKWKKSNWKTSSKKSVKNKELWIELYNESQKHNIEWKWVKGHSGHPENEIADMLANQAIDENY
jgi:ribonuclease HI|tara:strand:- start:342 stop:788 length:447 start_codon:yes stop_codon:yes gene_type:complete